jgi:hypothetical protein
MGWEYRVSKEIQTHKYRRYDPKIVYGIKEVFVEDSGDITHIPSTIPMCLSETIDELKTKIQKMMEACNKPVIDYNTGEEVNKHSPPT